MPVRPGQTLGDQHFPSMGDTYVVGMHNVGISVVSATVAVNTAASDAAIFASPPNTSGALVAGPVVHSLGAPPALVVIMPTASSGVVTAQFLTADNSAVYARYSSPGTISAARVLIQVSR